MGTPKQTNGPIHGVVCPHCGKQNDFRVLQEQQLLDTGTVASCDKCNRLMEVTRIQPVTVVFVRMANPNARATVTLPAASRGVAPARQATTLSPAQTRRLLRGR